MAIFVLLILIAGPMYAEFMGNSQIRNAAENTLTGVRLAQASAVQSNRAAKFVIDASAAGGWAVYALQRRDRRLRSWCRLQSYKWTEGASMTHRYAAARWRVGVTFDGLGRVAPNGYPDVADGTSSLTEVDVTNPLALPAAPPSAGPDQRYRRHCRDQALRSGACVRGDPARVPERSTQLTP